MSTNQDPATARIEHERKVQQLTIMLERSDRQATAYEAAGQPGLAEGFRTQANALRSELATLGVVLPQ